MSLIIPHFYHPILQTQQLKAKKEKKKKKKKQSEKKVVHLEQKTPEVENMTAENE